MERNRAWYNEMLGQRVVEALKNNNFQAQYVSTVEEAREIVLSLIPAGTRVGRGGSATIHELKIDAELEQRGCINLKHALTTLSPEEKMSIRRQQLTCDYFLCSSNAITEDGRLVNTDGVGNRVGAMAFGPKRVIVVAGINKVVKDLNSAFVRIEQYAAPINNKRLGKANPCTKTGYCLNCSSPERICNITTIMHKKPTLTDISVILVGCELGY